MALLRYLLFLAIVLCAALSANAVPPHNHPVTPIYLTKDSPWEPLSRFASSVIQCPLYFGQLIPTPELHRLVPTQAGLLVLDRC